MRTEYTDQEKCEIILSTILYHFAIDKPKLLSKSRKRNIVVPRQVFHYFLKGFTNYSYSRIGNQTNQDHATALHSLRTVKNLSDTNKEFRSQLDNIQIDLESRLKYNPDRTFFLNKLDVLDIINTSPTEVVLLKRMLEYFKITKNQEASEILENLERENKERAQLNKAKLVKLIRVIPDNQINNVYQRIEGIVNTLTTNTNLT